MAPLPFFYALSVWLHLVSLTLWIGAISFFLFVFGPAVRSMSPGEGVRILDQGRQSLQTLSWIAINLLILTGVLNLVLRGISGDLGKTYYSILAVKLFFFLAMFFHHSLQAFKYAPQIATLTAQATPEIQDWPEPLLSHWKKWFMLLKINATLGAIALLFGIGLARS